jgi:predicted RND superfamily exporter protein
VLHSLVSGLVAWASRRRTFVLVGVLAALVASVAGARRLSFDADVLSLLPGDSRVTNAFRSFLEHFGSLDQLYVVFTAPDGHGIDEYSATIDAWVEQLQAAPEIARVDATLAGPARDLEWLAGRQLLLLPDAARSEALKRLTPDGLTRAVADSRSLLSLPSPELKELVRQDPIGLFTLLRDSLGGQQAGLNLGPASEGYVTPDGRQRLVIARPRRPPFDTTFSHALADRLQGIEAAMRRTPAATGDADDEALPPLRVEFAGGHRIAIETEALVRRESILNTAGSLALILPLLFIVFRSSWLVLVGPLPSALSLVFVLGILGYVGARLSAAATGAAAMLFGLGVDGVVLLYVAYVLAPADDSDRVDIGAALTGPSTSMLLGMWTTAATFYGLMFVDFPSLQQLGTLIGHAMVICGLLTLFLVPALLPRRRKRHSRSLTMPRLAAWTARRHRAIVVVALLLTVALGIAARGLRINPTLERLRSVTPSAQLETQIAASFGLQQNVYVVLAQGPQLEPLLEANERLTARVKAELPAVGFQPPTLLLPSAAAQASRSQQIAAAGLTPDAVRASLETARVAGGFTPGSFDPFAARLPQMLDPGQRLTYDGFASHGLGDLLERFIVRADNQWLLATYAFPANGEQAARLGRIVEQIDPTQTLTGLDLVNGELARRFLPQFIKGLSIGTIMVIVLVGAAFRDWRLSFFALLPTVIGLIWTAGLLALAHVELDLFAVFAVVTFLGIGVDYGVHLVHRYQERHDALHATAELAPVILAAAGITLFGYATLINSSYPPLRSMGIVSVLSVVTLAAASLLVLPALLMSGTQR